MASNVYRATETIEYPGGDRTRYGWHYSSGSEGSFVLAGLEAHERDARVRDVAAWLAREGHSCDAERVAAWLYLAEDGDRHSFDREWAQERLCELLTCVEEVDALQGYMDEQRRLPAEGD